MDPYSEADRMCVRECACVRVCVRWSHKHETLNIQLTVLVTTSFNGAASDVTWRACAGGGGQRWRRRSLNDNCVNAAD